MTPRWRLVVWFLCIFLFAAGPKVERPKFLRAASILSEYDDIHVEIRIVPHSDIRYVTLEAWEAEAVGLEDPDMPTRYEPVHCIRGSSEPVTEGNAGQRTFRFAWRSLPSGHYVLIAKVVTSRYVSLETKHQLRVT